MSTIDIKELITNGHTDIINLMIKHKLFDIDFSCIIDNDALIKFINIFLDKQLIENPTMETIISKNLFDLIKLLLEKNLIKNVNEIFPKLSGFSLLTYMAQTEQWPIVKLLIEQGANVNHQTSVHKNTALMYATCYGHMDTVKLLLDAGAHVNLKNFIHQDSLYFAEVHNRKKIVVMLKRAKNKYNDDAYICKDIDGKIYPSLVSKRDICKAIFCVNSDKMPEIKTVKISSHTAIGKIWHDNKWTDYELINTNLYDIQIPVDTSIKVEYHVLSKDTTETYVKFPPNLTVDESSLGDIYQNF